MVLHLSFIMILAEISVFLKRGEGGIFHFIANSSPTGTKIRRMKYKVFFFFLLIGRSARAFSSVRAGPYADY